MRQIIGRLFNNLWSGMATGVVVTAVVMVPVMTSADAAVKLENSVGVANVTAGDADYKPEVAATNNQVVKVQVTFKNTEKPVDENVAKNVRAKVTLPADAGTNQTISATVKADNSEVVAGQATVKLDNENARLQYIPGSSVWKYNSGSREAPTVTTATLSDELALGAQGLVIGDVQAGDAYVATVTILARVIMPGVNVTTESQLKSDTSKWSSNNTAQPGVVMRHIISYQNTSATEQTQVVVRSKLAAKAQLVPGSTMLYNATSANGVKLADTVTDSGVNIGNYGPGANAYVTFEVTIAAADQLACGANELRSIGVVRPEGLNEHFATAITTVNRDCSQAGQPQNNQPAQPVFACTLLTVTKGEGRKVSAKVDYKAENGAKLKTVSYDFGDGSQSLVTDKTTVDHTYTKDGKFTVTAKLTITANGKDETVTSAPCAQPVEFTAGVVAGAATGKGSGNLPNSGAGDTFGLFIGATFVGFWLHRLVSRRLVR